VHNTNIDKSIGLIHKTVMRYLRKIHIKILNEENCVNALPVYEEFNKVFKIFHLIYFLSK
jgi:hypothetical protein